MAKLGLAPEVSNLTSWQELQRIVSIALKAVYTVLSNNINLEDNFRGKVLTVIFSAANTEVAIQHSLGYAPEKYILLNASVAMSLYNGATANNNIYIYLKSSAAGTATIMVL